VSPDVQISRAQPGDAEALTAIAFSAKRHWGYPERWIQRWRDQLTLTPDYVRAHPTFVARRGTEFVGFCAIRLGGAAAAVDHLWVVPEEMGRGVGKSLFAHCEGAARECGAILLTVESDPNAERFYLSMGAEAVGRKPAFMDGRERYLPLLEKSLNQHEHPTRRLHAELRSR